MSKEVKPYASEVLASADNGEVVIGFTDFKKDPSGWRGVSWSYIEFSYRAYPANCGVMVMCEPSFCNGLERLPNGDIVMREYGEFNHVTCRREVLNETKLVEERVYETVKCAIEEAWEEMETAILQMSDFKGGFIDRLCKYMDWHSSPNYVRNPNSGNDIRIYEYSPDFKS